jgi:hypothetical protein
VNAHVEFVHCVGRVYDFIEQRVIMRKLPLIHSPLQPVEIREHWADLLLDGFGLLRGNIFAPHSAKLTPVAPRWYVGFLRGAGNRVGVALAD